MGRKRKSHRNLPSRVYWKNNRYRLLTKEGKWITLGANLSQMYLSLSKFHDRPNHIASMDQMFDRYMLEIAPKKSKESFKNNVAQIKFLKQFFGKMPPESITPVHIYSFLDIRAEKGKIAANRGLSLLSHIFNYAIRWGALKNNPCKFIKKFSESKRNRNLTKTDFENVLKIVKYPVNYGMKLAYLMGLRPYEVINLKKDNISDEGFLVELSKTKNTTSKKLVTWSDNLKALISEIEKYHQRKNYDSEYFLVNRKGEPYTPSGFTTLWKRAVQKAIDYKIIDESFQFRDIRHLAATEMEKLHGRESARQFLGHTNQNTTARYIDGIPQVKGL